MSEWPSVKGRELLRVLIRNGWNVKRTTGSHKVLSKAGHEDFVFAFRDSEEIGPRMLARIGRATGLHPEDMR